MARRKGDRWNAMSREKQLLEVEDCVRVYRETGRTADEAVTFVAVVFTCLWPLRARVRLAWRLVSGR